MMRGSSCVMCWWIATMLILSLSSDLITGCNSSSVTAKSPSTTALSSVPANAAHVFTPMSLSIVTPCIFAARPVVNFFHGARQFIDGAFAFDVHEENFGLIEKEMVMERGHLETVIERSCHRSVHLVFKQNGVAHHHCFGVRAFCECRPGPETHEWRHRPSIHNDFYVIARERDSINALFLVLLSLEAGDLVDTRRVEASPDRA